MTQPTHGRPRGRRFLLAALAVVLLAGCAYFLRNRTPRGVDIQNTVRCTVRRGDLVVSILQSGEFKSRRNTSIKNEMEKSATIISIIEDGARVNVGDLLVELDAKEIQDALLQQQALASKAESDLVEAEKKMEIGALKQKADRESAELKVQLAELDLKKFLNGEFPKLKRKAEVDISLAQEEVNRAKEKLEWTRKLVQKGYTSEEELKTGQLEVTRKETELLNANEELRILIDFTFFSDSSEKKNALSEAKSELDRLIQSFESEQTSSKATIASLRVARDTANNQLKAIEAQLGQSQIRADFTGQVFYPPFSPYGREKQVEKGATVYPSQNLLMIPDLNSWQINVGVPESIINKIRRGQTAVATIDAIPGAVLDARVSKIGVVPDRENNWGSSSDKTYTVELDLPTTPTLPLKPGMSAMVEIITERLTQVLHAPIQAVTSEAGKQYVYVVQGGAAVKTPVRTGSSNDTDIQILEGASEGQELLLYAPVKADSRTGVEDSPLEKKSRQNAQDSVGPDSEGNGAAASEAPRDRTDATTPTAAAVNA